MCTIGPVNYAMVPRNNRRHTIHERTQANQDALFFVYGRKVGLLPLILQEESPRFIRCYYYLLYLLF